MNTAQTIAAAGFDIANLTAPVEKPSTFRVGLIFNKDGDAVSGLICVGKNSKEYRNESNALRMEGIKRGARTSTAIDTKTDEGAAQLVELTDENQKRLALAVSVDWFGFTSGDAAVPFDKSLVAAGFDKFPTWIDAVHAGLEKDAVFMIASSPASSTSPATSSNA